MSSILVIRLGAMGDILHALPAVSALKAAYPAKTLQWVVARKWLPLLTGNPDIDELIPFERSGLGSLRQLRRTFARAEARPGHRFPRPGAIGNPRPHRASRALLRF